MKNWNFDEIIDRRNTNSVKWEPDALRARFGQENGGLLPLWVADMDFYSPPAVKEAIEKRLAHQIYGYSSPDSAYYEAVVSWFSRRHQWTIKKEWILRCTGIVPALHYVVQCFTQPGDSVLLQSPVYYPFAQSITHNDRNIADNPLTIVDGRYRMDFEDLQKKVQDPQVKLAILCSPHNPVGRVWTKEELEQFGRICLENQVLVLADEIHCDLLMPGHRHTSFQGISEEFALHSIAAISASKTFNLAGLRQANLVIPNEKIKLTMAKYLRNLGLGPEGDGTLFGAIAAQAAYTEAEDWLDDLLLYLHDNALFLKKKIEAAFPGVTVFNLEGTYLAWIDFRPLAIPSSQLVKIIEGEAKVALDHGFWFGENGHGFERINIACPRTILAQAIDAMIAALQDNTVST